MSWKKVAFVEDVATLSDTPPVDVTKAAAAEGTATDASRQDHKHDVTTGVPGTIGESDTPAEGSATSLARSDHVHGSPATYAPSTHTLDSHGNPTGPIEINKQSLVNPILDPQATDPVSPADYQIYTKTADKHLYVYVPA